MDAATAATPKPQYPFDLPDEREASGVLRKSKSQLAFINANDLEELKIAPYVVFKSISLAKFIEKLVYFPSATMCQYFTLTYRAYGSPLLCAEMLLDRFRGPTEDFQYIPSQKDFYEAKKNLIQSRVRTIAAEFVYSLEMVDYRSDYIRRIRGVMESIFQVFPVDVLPLMDQMTEQSQSTRSRSRILIRDNAVLLKSEFTLLSQLDVDDVASTITMKDMGFFKKIKPSELVTLAWSGKDPRTHAPNVSAATDYFNWVSTWIAAKLLAGKTAAERASTIEFFVQVGMKFKSIHNYNGVMQIVCSLNCAAISRLKQTWELVSEQTRRDKAILELLMSTARNSNEYRRELAGVAENVPCLPFFGLFLTDIMFTVTGNTALANDNLINVNLVLGLGKIMASLRRYQLIDYNLGAQCYLKLENVWGESELYELSFLREPSMVLSSVQPSEYSSSSPSSSPTIKRRPTSGSRSPLPVGLRSPVSRNGSNQVTFIPNDDFVPRVGIPSKDDFKHLTSSSKQHRYNAGQTFVREGYTNKSLYYILDGEVSYYKRPYKKPILTLRHNEILNVISFLSGAGCWATAKANVDTTVLVISEEDASNLLNVDSAIAARFHKMFGRKIAGAIRAYMAIKSDPTALGPNSDHEEDEDEDDSEFKFEDEDDQDAQDFFGAKNVAPFEQLVYTSPDGSPRPSVVVSKSPDGSPRPSGWRPGRRGSEQYARRSEVAVKSFTCRSGLYTGNLCITLQYTLFYARIFGFVRKHTINNQKVSNVTLGHLSVSIQIGSGVDSERCKMIFKNEEDALEAKNTLDKICKSYATTPSSGVTKSTDVDSIMQEREWKLLLKGAQCVNYKKGAILIQEGSKCKSLFQIVEGKCSIQRSFDTVTKTLAMRENSVLGEMSLFDEYQVASASVVAETDVEAYVLSAAYINILLNHHSEMAPKFYKYLSSLMIKRLLELDDAPHS